MEIKLANGKSFNYDNIDKPYVQRILRKAYDKDNENRAYCQCNSKQPPEMVLAYLRPSDHFFIRRMPGQSPLKHDKGCFFRTHKPQSNYSGKNGLTLAIPNSNNPPVTDHQHAQTILKALWGEVESTYLAKSERMSWRVLKDIIRLVAEMIDVNRNPLLDVLSVVVPKLKESLTDLDFPEGRVVVCELMEAKQIKSGSIRIKAKGILNTAWLNDFRIQHLEESTKERLLLDRKDMDADKRYVMLMTLINGKAEGNDLHCSSVALIEVDKESFVQV